MTHNFCEEILTRNPQYHVTYKNIHILPFEIILCQYCIDEIKLHLLISSRGNDHEHNSTQFTSTKTKMQKFGVWWMRG